MASKFVCRLYSTDPSLATQTGNNSKSNDIDVVRKEAFCQKTKDVGRILPTAETVSQLKLCYSTLKEAPTKTAYGMLRTYRKCQYPTWNCMGGWLKTGNLSDLGNDIFGERRV